MAETIFADQTRAAASNSRFILFVVSDGGSTDGDPRRAAARLRRRGVQLISCFVSSTDVGEGKRLYAKKRPDWPDGAQVMFDMASPAPHESAECRYLKDLGWHVEDTSSGKSALRGLMRLFGQKDSGAVKLFAHVNHSALLDEFLKVVLVLLYAESGLV